MQDYCTIIANKCNSINLSFKYERDTCIYGGNIDKYNSVSHRGCVSVIWIPPYVCAWISGPFNKVRYCTLCANSAVTQPTFLGTLSPELHLNASAIQTRSSLCLFSMTDKHSVFGYCWAQQYHGVHTLYSAGSEFGNLIGCKKPLFKETISFQHCA